MLRLRQRNSPHPVASCPLCVHVSLAFLTFTVRAHCLSPSLFPFIRTLPFGFCQRFSVEFGGFSHFRISGLSLCGVGRGPSLHPVSCKRCRCSEQPYRLTSSQNARTIKYSKFVLLEKGGLQSAGVKAMPLIGLKRCLAATNNPLDKWNQQSLGLQMQRGHLFDSHSFIQHAVVPVWVELILNRGCRLPLQAFFNNYSVIDTSLTQA